MGGPEAEELFRKLEKHYEGSNLFEEHDLLRHNQSVFQGGVNALKVFPPLQELYPEAKLNLIIHHLKENQIEEAFKKTHDMKPLTPREYILKGVVYSLFGQLKENQEYLQTAQQQFQLIGTSATECDTVSGRQCIASYLFLKKQFEDVILYLKTIQEFMANDDSFNWNYGIALASTGKFQQAEEILMLVQSEDFRQEFIYNAWLAKSFIRNGKPELAWNLYLEMDTSNEIVGFVSLIANECYSSEYFFFALKAFDILERLDNNDYTDAKLGSAAGVFKDFLTNKLLINQMEESVQILRAGVKNARVEDLLKTIEPFLGEEEE